MKPKSLTSYLLSSGIDRNSSPEEIQAAKAAYRKQYLSEKKAAFRKKHRSITLSFPNTEARGLEREAEKYQMKLPAYLKSCISAYRAQTFVLPDDSRVRSLELGLQEMLTEVYRIGRMAQMQDSSVSDVLSAIEQRIAAYDNQISQALRSPDSTENMLKSEIAKDPLLLLVLLRIITDYLKPLLNAHQDYKTL